MIRLTSTTAGDPSDNPGSIAGLFILLGGLGACLIVGLAMLAIRDHVRQALADPDTCKPYQVEERERRVIPDHVEFQWWDLYDHRAACVVRGTRLLCDMPTGRIITEYPERCSRRSSQGGLAHAR